MLVRLLSRIYRLVLSPALHLLAGSGFGCRFEPTCGKYAETAFIQHGLWRGGYLTLRRILRCHPFSKAGFDPVPEVRN